MEEAKSEIEVDRPGEASCLARYSRSILVTQWEEPGQERIEPSARWLFRFDEVDLLAQRALDEDQRALFDRVGRRSSQEALTLAAPMLHPIGVGEVHSSTAIRRR